jgi:hypothetical protein
LHASRKNSRNELTATSDLSAIACMHGSFRL